ncbi:hypothetical protein M5K25_008946 [Dendrobium thyrsiflorum]|uniref:Uncharacterized protein n=1 Tax=Dendrobium thyrsiflorum TaxID=117978 RepID=A0ABD0V9Z8_DENTH
MSAKRKTLHKHHHKSQPSRQMSHRNDHRNDPWKISMDGLRLQSITETRCEPHHQAESKTSWLPRKTIQGADCSIIIVLVQQATTNPLGSTWLPKLTIQLISRFQAPIQSQPSINSIFKSKVLMPKKLCPRYMFNLFEVFQDKNRETRLTGLPAASALDDNVDGEDHNARQNREDGYNCKREQNDPFNILEQEGDQETEPSKEEYVLAVASGLRFIYASCDNCAGEAQAGGARDLRRLLQALSLDFLLLLILDLVVSHHAAHRDFHGRNDRLAVDCVARVNGDYGFLGPVCAHKILFWFLDMDMS